MLFRITVTVVLFCSSTVARDNPDVRIEVIGMKAGAGDTLQLRLLNVSGRDLRVPPIAGFCRAMPGTVNAALLERPDSQNTVRYGMGCTVCGEKPVSILEQAKRWWPLKPGQFIDVPIHMGMMLPLHEEGIYRFRLIYSAQSFTPIVRRELTDAGILVPTTDAESGVVGIKFGAGRISLLK